MAKNQIMEDIWYAVLSENGYITYTSRSQSDAEETANTTDDVIILNNLGSVKNIVDNEILP